MKKTLLSLVAIVAILGLSVGIFAGLVASKKKPDKKTAEVQRTLVEVMQAERKSVTFDVSSQGTVLPRTETTLYPEVAGEIIYVSPSLFSGGFFEKDEVLLKIDPSNYETAILSTEAQLARAQVTLMQEKVLAEQALKDWIALGNTREDATSLVLREPQLKEAEANVRSAEAALSMAQRDLRKTEIRSPYEGMVRNRFADLGQVVNQGTELAAIFAVDFVEIRLPLTAEDLQFVDLPYAFRGGKEAVNKPKVVLTSRFGGLSESWVGSIVRTEGTIDPKSRVMYAVARVEDPYGLQRDDNAIPLSVGMFVEASISGKTFDDVAVFPRYVLRGKSQVLIVNDEEKINRRDVTVLKTDSKQVYIGDGVNDGERVCLTALEFVVEGMPVEPVEGEDNLALIGSRGVHTSSL